jgi:tetratricopeptide (TPR) repeat protein
MSSQIEISPLEWDIIETYLDQKETSDKATELYEEVSKIPNFDKKIAHVKKVREEIEDSIRQSKIKEFHEHVAVDDNDSNVKKLSANKGNQKVVWYSIAAVLVVLIGIFWMMESNNSPERIFAENFKPDIGLPLKMGTTDNYDFYEGMIAYKQEDYQAAIAKWKLLLKNNPENDTLNYFLGVSHLAQGNAEKSLKYLKNQDRFQQSIFKEDAAYYAALANIKEGKTEAAILLLKKYPSNRNTALLEQLDN